MRVLHGSLYIKQNVSIDLKCYGDRFVLYAEFYSLFLFIRNKYILFLRIIQVCHQ